MMIGEDGTDLMPTVNLDDLSIDPDDLAIAAGILKQLADYAETKASAMRHRAAGRIHRAWIAEAACERIYASLPPAARW